MSFPLLHSHALVRKLLQLNPKVGPAVHLIYVLGQTTESRHDTDRELPFRQVSTPARTGDLLLTLERRKATLHG